MLQQILKKVYPFAFVLAFLVACSEDAPQTSTAGESNTQNDTNTETGNGKQTDDKTQEDDEEIDFEQDIQQSELDWEGEIDYDTSSWETYDNYRFAFTINYPASWVIGEEAQNGDGVSLYEDAENEIVVYGSLDHSDIYDPYEDAEKEGFTSDKIMLENGDEADYIVGLEDGKVLFKVLFMKDWVVYTFYAKVTPEFFDENLDLLLQTAKSLNVYEIE